MGPRPLVLMVLMVGYREIKKTIKYGERKNDKNDKRRSLINDYKYDKIAVFPRMNFGSTNQCRHPFGSG